MARGGKKRKHLLFRSRVSDASSGRDSSSFLEEHLLIGGPGFSRVIFCNDPNCAEAALQKYKTNYVRSTKYTLATFLPKSLFEQFRRVANVYFLICALLAFTPLSPYSALSSVLPLVVVMGVTMGKEILEDWRRKMQVIKRFKLCYHFNLIEVYSWLVISSVKRCI